MLVVDGTGPRFDAPKGGVKISFFPARSDKASFLQSLHGDTIAQRRRRHILAKMSTQNFPVASSLQFMSAAPSSTN